MLRVILCAGIACAAALRPTTSETFATRAYQTSGFKPLTRTDATPSDEESAPSPARQGRAMTAEERLQLFGSLADGRITELTAELAIAKDAGDTERCEEIDNSIGGLRQQYSDAAAGKAQARSGHKKA